MQAISASSGGPAQYKGPIDCVRQVVRSEGPAGLLRGFLPTLSSRIVGLPFYLGGYWVARRAISGQRGETTPSFTTTMLAGGFAGVAFWSANYPLDIVKVPPPALIPL